MAKVKKKRKRRKTERNLGAPPGFLKAAPDARASKVRVMTYDATQIAELDALGKVAHRVTWIDVVGLADTELIERVGKRVGMHPLALEDVVQPHQRPKFEDYDDGLFVVARVAREVEGQVDIEQISLFLGKDTVVTFQEREGDAFEPVRQRIRGSLGRIRTLGPAYLFYALLDAIVDAMFPLLEGFDERLDELESHVFESTAQSMAQVHEVQRDLMSIRRAVLPLREALNRLTRSDHALLDDDLRLYLRDCHDHLTQQVDLLDGQRELAKYQLDASISHLGHRSNEVMKVLTMIATIFIPLSFIAGLYGMNFDTAYSTNMPELGSPWGYLGVVSIMLSIALGMLWFFRKKRWL